MGRPAREPVELQVAGKQHGLEVSRERSADSPGALCPGERFTDQRGRKRVEERHLVGKARVERGTRYARL
jgi:hypothetical protein